MRLVFLVSGEHETLPFSEVRAILESGGFGYKVVETLPQALCLESEEACVVPVSLRSAFTRVLGLELFRCKAHSDEILMNTAVQPYEEHLGKGQTFSVRVRRVQGSSTDLDLRELEAQIGERILEKVSDARVMLRNPEKAFLGVLTGEKFIFVLKLAEVSPQQFLVRRPGNRPFFHPSALTPKLARCMVNLARPRLGDVVFDPFCGTGSILIETALMGFKILGGDIKRHMVIGTMRNLRHFGIKDMGVVVEDARKMPLSQADCVVTDPPYGRSSSTLKSTTEEIVSEFLTKAFKILNKGGHICIASPRTLEISAIGRKAGYKVVEAHYVRVHRSLTREIAVLKKA